jgi:hypothetical protein
MCVCAMFQLNNREEAETKRGGNGGRRQQMRVCTLYECLRIEYRYRNVPGTVAPSTTPSYRR